MQKILIKAGSCQQAVVNCQEYLLENAYGMWAYDAEPAQPDSLDIILAEQYDYLQSLNIASDKAVKDVSYSVLFDVLGTRLGNYMENLPFFNLVENSIWVEHSVDGCFLVNVDLAPQYLN